MKKIDLKINFDEVIKRIENLHEYKNIKPSKWANKVGVSRSVISNIHGKTHQKPSLEYIIAVSNATGKSIEFLLYGIEKKDRKLDSLTEEKQDIDRLQGLNPALDEFINVLPLDDSSARQALSGVLKIIVSGLKSKTETETWNNKIQQLEAENNNLKIIAREANQNFKDLINALEKIITKHSPPDSVGERRSSMVDISNLLTKTQNILNSSKSLSE